jgi:Ca2+-binding RTX toxin-like protein
MAARSGTGTASVTIDGLPPTVTSGTVYTEGRSVAVANGSFTDTFERWGVHVYHFDVPATPPPAQPTIASFAPASGGSGTLVTIAGANLAGATAVTFGGAGAGFTQVSPTELTATVPAAALTGPIAVTTPGGTAVSATPFTVTAPVPPSESPNPGGSSGGQAGPAPAPPTPPPAPAESAPTAPAPLAGTQPTRARATSRADRLVGTSRRDTLRGLGGGDTILGLAGDDLLDGGTGNDTLVGGKGRDLLYGRTGNDVLSVRDGTRDRVSCGKGRDRVIADRRDAVSRDCERVVRR